jgi:hypothetical protein
MRVAFLFQHLNGTLLFFLLFIWQQHGMRHKPRPSIECNIFLFQRCCIFLSIISEFLFLSLKNLREKNNYISFYITAVHCKRTEKDTKLQQQITELVKGFHGEIGVYVHDLKHNKTVAINADTIFPTASIVKISILIGIMNKIEHAELDYHQRLLYTDSLYYSRRR